MREIRNLYRFIPFGKFSLSGRGKPPFNQVFVGRQKERASFIDLLTHQESFGAFLVSGQRGAGKTSFVQYCLNEYERMAYQRSIRISRTSALSGLILLFVFALIAVAAYVLLTQALELGAQNVMEAILAAGVSDPRGMDGVASAAVIWIAPLFLFGSALMILPILFAFKAVTAIAAVKQDFWWFFSWIWCAVLLLCMPLGLWLITDYLELMPLDLDSVLHAYLWTIVPLFAMAQLVQLVCDGSRFSLRTGRWLTRVAVVFALLSGLMALMNIGMDEDGADLSDLVLMMVTYTCAVWAVQHLLASDRRRLLALFLGVLAVLLLCAQILVRFEFGQPGLPWESSSNPDKAAALLQNAPGILFFVAVIYWSSMRSAHGPDKANDGMPTGPFKTILLLKGSLLVILGFVGLLPLFRVIVGWYYLVAPGRSVTVLEAMPELAQTHASYLTIMLLVVLTAVIYAAEYVWICRDFRSYRQDAAIGLLGRSKTHQVVESAWDSSKVGRATGDGPPKWWWPHFAVRRARVRKEGSIGASREAFVNINKATRNHPMVPPNIDDNEPDYITSRLSGKRRFVFRQLEHATLPHLVYSVRHPVLTVWINLGFDNLEHSRIIEAMLRRLRGLYQQRFSSLSSPIGILNAFLLIASTVVFTSLVSKSVFHITNLNEMERPEGFKYRFEGAQVSTRSRFGETNYCGFFEVYPELAPNVKSLICALPFNNALMELLYSPVLQIHADFSSNVATSHQANPWREGDASNPLETSDPSKKLWRNGCGGVWQPDVAAHTAPQARRPGPLGHTDWSTCLPYFGAAPKKDTVKLRFKSTKKGRAAKPLGPLAPHLTATYGDLFAAQRDNRDLGRKLRNWIGPWVGCATPAQLQSEACRIDDAPKIVSPEKAASPLIGDSELVSFLLDQNFGLPRIDFDTPRWPGQEDGTAASDYTGSDGWYAAYSPFKAGASGPPTLRVYHLALYGLGFWMFFSLNRRLRLLPYRANMDAINELILLINGRETLRTGDKEVGGWLAWVLPFRRPERMIETSNDPRIVEQRLIELLHDLRPSQANQRSRITNIFEIRPEITFIFDEMDKLSGIVDPELSKDAEGLTQLEENNRERARSLQLHQLLSDMKRLISGNAARFIFIGGRLYHDEWLADQAQRAPILNSIFNGQIYLPSLMADRSHPYGRFNDRVTELVTLMYRNARHRLKNWSTVRRAGAFGGNVQSEGPTYVQFELPFSSHPRRLTGLAHYTGMRVIDGAGKNYTVAAGRWFNAVDSSTKTMSLGEQETFDQFINFLTYRSAGNPKKLKELIQGLVQTSSVALALPRYPASEQRDVRWDGLRDEGHDMITLNDNAIYRMQFIDMLYRHLADHMEGRMLDRDDKVSISIFYLMDFLMKFHNRGFSRTNLQRVDELSHIHRAPDLRSVMGILVQVSSERFLHRVLNGVYNFRFRSDFAREIDYLSRISKEEMAALNFTLDESQSLKGLYQQTINTGERENIDTVAGLGELYEYDQEYEIARNYYRRAITMLDHVQMDTVQTRSVIRQADGEGFERLQGAQDSGFVELRMLGDIMMSSDNSHKRKVFLAQIHWVVARIRLMLQVGQTYEEEMNFERANATYTHTAQLCDHVFQAMATHDRPPVKTQPKNSDPLFKIARTEPDIDVNSFPILFQAGIAAAWVQEKDPENIDQSVIFAENWLQRMYEREPLLQRPLPLTSEYSRFQYSNGGILVQVSLSHDRIGDLYFMKGRQSFKTTHIEDIAKYVARMSGADTEENAPEPVSRRAGYLDQAHYHYAMALWLLRKYLTHRHRMSQASWTWIGKVDVFDVKGLAPSHFHSTLADVVTDLSEVIFAKRSSLATAQKLLNSKVEKRFTDPVYLDGLRNFQRYQRCLLNESVDDFAQAFIKNPDSPKYSEKNWGHWFDGVSRELIKVVPKAGINELRLRADKPNRKPRTLKPEMSKRLQTLTEDAQLGGDGSGSAAGRNFRPVFDVLNIRSSEGANPIKNWIGLRAPGTMMNKKEFADPDTANKHFETPMLTADAPGGPYRHLEAYLFFSQAAARASQRIGQSTNAANEFLLQCDAMISTLWDARILRFIRKQDLKEWHGFTAFFETVKLKGDANPSMCDVMASRIGLAAFGSLKDAVERIQFAERPSVTRMSMNHGNPAGMEAETALLGELAVACEDAAKGVETARHALNNAFSKPQMSDVEKGRIAVRLTTAELTLRNAEDALAQAQATDKAARRELGADYDLSQAFRDDPRPITQACSLILALLNGSAGPISIGVAGLVYRDILCKVAGETFDVRMIEDVPASDLLITLLETGEVPSEIHVQIGPSQNLLERLKQQLFFHTFAGLKTTLERFRYPVLNRLQGLKVLCDGLVLGDVSPDNFKKHFGTRKSSEVGRLLREMIATSDIYGSEMHFSANAVGTSAGLVFLRMLRKKSHILYDDMTEDEDIHADGEAYFDSSPFDAALYPEHRPQLNKVIMTREAIGEFAINKLNRSQETCSMGDAYYENVAYLHTLNDDFNDRSIHFTHARNMAGNDLSEVLALMIKSGFKTS